MENTKETKSGIQLHSNISDLDDKKATIQVTEMKIPRQLGQKQYVVRENFLLDTNLANESKSKNLVTFVWDFANKDAVNVSANSLKSIGLINNIIGLRLSVPELISPYAIDGGRWNQTRTELTSIYKIAIEEFNSNAYYTNILNKQIFYHFLCHPKQMQNPVFNRFVKPYQTAIMGNDGYFWFNEPLLDMPTTLTLKWYKHYHEMAWPIVKGCVPHSSAITKGVTTTISYGYLSDLPIAEVGDRVIFFNPVSYGKHPLSFINYFAKLDDNNPDFLSWEGYEVLSVTSTNFVVDYDSTNWVGPIPTSVMFIKKGSGIKMNLEIIYLLEKEKRTSIGLIEDDE